VASSRLILIAGASGYVGGRLLKRLEAEGRSLRCLARRPEHLAARVAATTEVVAADVRDRASLTRALEGVDTAYYLVHAMGEKSAAFASEERLGAINFGDAAHVAGVRRIVYLGGLADPADSLSAHLRSRLEVGEVLRQSGVPVVEFRASIIIGSGSLSFELVRSLVERLPLMICPRWVATQAQPIAIEDVLAYLVAAADLPQGPGRVYEIGGAEVVSYGDVMREYARQRGLKRVLIPVPFLTPFLSSLWLGLVTPVFAHVGRKLIAGVSNPSVVRDPAALADFAVRPRGLAQAISRAISNEDRELAETRWSDSLGSAGRQRTWAGVRFGTRLVDSRTVDVPVGVASAFAPIRRIGGANGWYAANLLWRIRGYIDLLAGGVGMRRGRRDPEELRVGDHVDSWRVEAYEPNRRLRLAAEMKLPGRAWLEFEVEGDDRSSTIRQTAVFDPVGLSGLAYWYALYPAHALVFSGMLEALAARSRRERRRS